MTLKYFNDRSKAGGGGSIVTLEYFNDRSKAGALL